DPAYLYTPAGNLLVPVLSDAAQEMFCRCAFVPRSGWQCSKLNRAREWKCVHTHFHVHRNEIPPQAGGHKDWMAGWHVATRILKWVSKETMNGLSRHCLRTLYS